MVQQPGLLCHSCLVLGWNHKPLASLQIQILKTALLEVPRLLAFVGLQRGFKQLTVLSFLLKKTLSSRFMHTKFNRLHHGGKRVLTKLVFNKEENTTRTLLLNKSLQNCFISVISSSWSLKIKLNQMVAASASVVLHRRGSTVTNEGGSTCLFIFASVITESHLLWQNSWKHRRTVIW